MANPSITRVLLNAAKVLVGAKRISLRGAADDFFTLGKSGDVGGGVKGVQGDVALFDSENNLRRGTHCVTAIGHQDSASMPAGSFDLRTE